MASYLIRDGVRSLAASSLMVSLLLFAAIFSVADEPDPDYPPQTHLIPLTVRLPQPDEVEVAVISTDGIRPAQTTISALALAPKQVVELAQLWRSQHWSYTDHSGVDDPQFRIRFFRHRSLFLEATLGRTTDFWDMVVRKSNLKPISTGEAMFDSRFPEGREMNQFFKQIVNSSFLLAVRRGDIVQVKTLLEYGPDIKATDSDGYDAVALALDLPTPYLAVYLLNHGANRHAINQLMIAAMMGDVKRAKQLIDQEGVKVRVRDEWDGSALSYAVQYGRKSMTELLLNRDVDVNELTPSTLRNRPYSGGTVLFTVSDEHPEMVAFLKSHGANMDHEDDAGFPALYWAVLWGKANVVHALIDAGANVNQMCGNSRSILSSVLLEPNQEDPAGREECIAILKQAGAKRVDHSRPPAHGMD